MTTQRAETLTTPQLGRYEIDASGSTVRFRTRHLFGLAPVRGEFAIRTGTVDVTEPLADSRDLRGDRRGEFPHRQPATGCNVRSAQFLDTSRYPVMAFVAERVEGTAVTGSLTVRDVTRPVRLSVEPSAASPRGNSPRA